MTKWIGTLLSLLVAFGMGVVFSTIFVQPPPTLLAVGKTEKIITTSRTSTSTTTNQQEISEKDIMPSLQPQQDQQDLQQEIASDEQQQQQQQPQEIENNPQAQEQPPEKEPEQPQEQQQENTSNYQLRVDWSNLPVISDLAKEIEKSQTECSPKNKDKNAAGQKFIIQPFGSQNGLGQNIHLISQAFCNAMERDARLLMVGGWGWSPCRGGWENSARCFFGPHINQTKCGQGEPNQYPMAFVTGENRHHQPTKVTNILTTDPRIVKIYKGGRVAGGQDCKNYFKNLESRNLTVSDFRAASIEWMFSSVSDRVIQEAQRQVREAFPEGLPDPERMVTVHVRWGDKGREMTLQPISRYIAEIKNMVGQDRFDDQTNPLHAYLTTEDPAAADAFRKEMPQHWIVHQSGPMQNSQGSKSIMKYVAGDVGLQSMGALLVSMQSNYYVLTLKSNWSRLINELRKNIVDPRCGGCTQLADLFWGEW